MPNRTVVVVVVVAVGVIVVMAVPMVVVVAVNPTGPSGGSEYGQAVSEFTA